METVGYAALQIIPTTKGLGTALTAQTAAPLAASGKAAGSKFATALTGASSPAFKTLAKGAGAVGLAAGVGVGLAVKSFADFDKAMSGVEAATQGTTGEMDSLRDAAMKAGADTVFSATEAAAGVTELAKAGVDTADILNGGLNGALDLAAAGSIGVGEAAETAAMAMSQFGLAGSDVPHVADLLAAAAGKAQGEVSDMSYALKQSGLVADQTGLSIEETTGALAAFADKGLIGSDAGTSLKTMLQALTPSTVKAQSAMESLNIEAYDQQGNFVGLAEYAGKLRAGLSDMSDEQRNATMKTIFGSDAVRAATVLYDSGAKGIDKWVKAVDDQGFAAETAATKLDNFAGDLEALKGSLETALIGTGEGADGPLRDLTKSLTGLINKYNELPDGAKTAVLAIGSVTAVTGTGLWVFSKAITGLSNLADSLGFAGDKAKYARGAMKGGLVGAGAIAAVIAYREGLNAISDWVDKNSNDTGNTGDSRQALSLLATGVGDVTGEFDGMESVIQRISDKNLYEGMADGFGLPAYSGGGLSLDEATSQAKALDDALTAMVDSGNAAGAAKGLERMAKAQDLNKSEMEALLKLLPEYRDALDVVAGQELRASTKLVPIATTTREAIEAVVEANNDGSAAARRAQDAVDKLTYSHSRATDQLVNQRIAQDKLTASELGTLNKKLSYSQSLLDAEQAVVDAKVGAKSKEKGDGGFGLDLETQAGIDNVTVLQNMAVAWNDLGKGVQAQKGKYQGMRQELIDTAIQLGGNREEAKKYARELLENPGSITTKAEFHAEKADELRAALEKKYGKMPKKLSTWAELKDWEAIQRHDHLVKLYGKMPERITTKAEFDDWEARRKVKALKELYATVNGDNFLGGLVDFDVPTGGLGGGKGGKGGKGDGARRGPVTNDNRQVFNGPVTVNDERALDRRRQRRDRQRNLTGN